VGLVAYRLVEEDVSAGLWFLWQQGSRGRGRAGHSLLLVAAAV